MNVIRHRAIFTKGGEVAGAFNDFPSDTTEDVVVDVLRQGLVDSGRIDSSWTLDSLNGLPVYFDEDAGMMLPIGGGAWMQS